MNQETIKQVKQELQPLIDKLGEGAQFTYETMYQQVINEAIIYGGIVLAALIPLVILAYYIVRAIKKHKDTDDTVFALALPIFMAWSVWLIAGMSTLVKSVLTLMNPHYYTIEELLRIVSGG